VAVDGPAPLVQIEPRLSCENILSCLIFDFENVGLTFIHVIRDIGSWLSFQHVVVVEKTDVCVQQNDQVEVFILISFRFKVV